MGAGASKPQEHVFTASTPVNFAPDLLKSLESSSETDNTRASDLELHIQRRVERELRRLDKETDTSIRELKDRLSASQDKAASKGSSTTSKKSPPKTSPQESTEQESDRTQVLSRARVQAEIDTLKKKLQARKMRDDVVEDKAVNKTKGKVVQCLRVNDRRPLDCWQEVEDFKREVSRLESSYLGRVID